MVITMKRKLSLLLAMLSIISTMSCGESSDESESTTLSDDTSVEETTRSKSGVPDSLDLEGQTITIWYTTKSVAASETFVDLNPELTGDVLDDAIFNMNKEVEQKLNCTLEFYNSDTPSSETGTAMQKLVLANDDTYDMYHVVQHCSANLATEGYYLNMADAKYISYDEPWWDYKYMKEMTIGEDKIFCLSGDFAVDRTRCLNCFYYNKSLYEDFYKDPDGLYTDVMEGTWTWDKLRTICSEVYLDINNNGTADRGDRFGYITNNYNNIDLIFYATGARATERDKDDIPQIVLNSERNISVLQDLYKLIFETEGVYNSGALYDDDLQNRQEFIDGNSMFIPGFFYTSEALREMKSDYGIIPVPKYNEEQEEYYSDTHDIIRLMVVPVTCNKVDSVSAVLEEMAYIGYRDVVSAYYDVALKGKYVRDDVSAQILDIIRDSCSPELAHMVNFNSIGYIQRRLIENETSDFASTYATYYPTAQQKLDDFIELYQKD